MFPLLRRKSAERIFLTSLVSVIDGFEPFQVQSRGSDTSWLRVKYNPTIKYNVELARNNGSQIGQLRIMTRTQLEVCSTHFSISFARWNKNISLQVFRSIRLDREADPKLLFVKGRMQKQRDRNRDCILYSDDRPGTESMPGGRSFPVGWYYRADLSGKIKGNTYYLLKPISVKLQTQIKPQPERCEEK